MVLHRALAVLVIAAFAFGGVQSDICDVICAGAGAPSSSSSQSLGHSAHQTSNLHHMMMPGMVMNGPAPGQTVTAVSHELCEMPMLEQATVSKAPEANVSPAQLAALVTFMVDQPLATKPLAAKAPPGKHPVDVLPASAVLRI